MTMHRFTIIQGTLDDVLEAYHMHGVRALRLLPGRIVELESDLTAGQLAMLVLGTTHGRVVLAPDDSAKNGGTK